MQTKLRADAREWIASDLYVYLPEAPSPEELDAITALEIAGVQRTDVTELYSMTSSAAAPDAALVFLKVVDPARYPFYGTIELNPPMVLREALAGGSVAVSRDLLDRMKLSVGGALRFGKAEFRIAAVIDTEPDWSAGVSTALPRVLLSPESLSRAGIALQGNVSHKLLFRLGAADLGAVRVVLEKTFPYADVVDYRDPDANAAAAFEQAARFLNIAAWMALAFGSLAMATIMYLHVQSRLDSVAVMRALGASSGQVVAIYTFQAMGLALSGGVAGACLALPLGKGLASLAQQFFPIGYALPWDWSFAFEAIAVGLLAAVPSVAGPIFTLRRARPMSVLRRSVEAGHAHAPRHRRVPHFLPLSMRLTARTLFRRGRHSRAIIAVLAGGVAMLNATYTCQRQISENVAKSVPAGGANLYIISAGPRQLNEASHWLSTQPGVKQALEAFPLVWLRLLSRNGIRHSVASGLPGRWLATCSANIRPGEIFLSKDDPHSPLKPGDTLEFAVKGHSLRGRVANHSRKFLGAAVSILTLPCSDLQGLPVYYHAAVRIDPSHESDVRQALAARYPDLPTLSRAEFTALVARVAGSAITMMQLLCWSVLALGIILAMLLIAATRPLRQEEIANLKVLGAAPGLISRMQALEFGVLGLLAGAAGSVLGSLLASLLLSRILHQATLAFDLRVILIGTALTGLLTAVAGSSATASMLRRKPLEVLRAP